MVCLAEESKESNDTKCCENCGEGGCNCESTEGSQSCCGKSGTITLSSEDEVDIKKASKEDLSDLNAKTKLSTITVLVREYMQNKEDVKNLTRDLYTLGISGGCGMMGALFASRTSLEDIYKSGYKSKSYTVNDFIRDVNGVLKKYGVSPRQIRERLSYIV